MRLSYLHRQNSWVAFEKCETEIPIKKALASPKIKRTKCPLTLAWAPAVHKFHGFQIYTALSRVKTYDNLYCIWQFKKSAIKVNKDALLEYERLKENDLFFTLKRSIISDDTITILVHNVRSISKPVNEIVRDSRITNNDIIALTETQISLSDSTCRIVETLNSFNINLNNSD